MRVRIACLCACFFPVLATAQTTLESGRCGSVNQSVGFGPFDYRVAKDKLPVVENHHFDVGVETLTRKKTGSFGGDIDYTLRHFPNHHRALMTMVNLGLREKTDKPKGSRYTIDCWFVRAEQYQPDDGMVKLLYGLYHLKHGRSGEAVKKLEEARKVAGENANIHYNLGLAYLDLEQYDKALESAHTAYRLGFPLPGLKDRLRRAGKWREAAG